MKNIFNALKVFISIIALLVFASGVVLTALGGYDLIQVFSHIGSTDKHALVGSMAIGLLQAVDLFLIAIVFFVLCLGILILFNNPEKELPVKLPEWLRVKNFMQLKVILWESILTTLVVSYLAGLVQKKIQGIDLDVQTLIIPAGILLIAVSLYFLKKGETDHSH